MKRSLLGLFFLTALFTGIQNKALAVLPTITPGSISPVCAGVYGVLPYTATGSPSTYNISWIGSPVGLPDVAPGTVLPLTSIPIIVYPSCANGTYSGTIVVTNSSGSSAPMSISITVHGLPTVYAITGGGGYCSGGSGVHLGLSSSDGGVIYQLERGGVAYGTTFWGTGGPLDFGIYTLTGTYTVTAKNAVTYCTNDMAGSATISTLPTPPIVSVTGGGNYCEGGAGLPVGLTGSIFGAEYQLYRGGVAVGSPIPGLGMAIDFGPQTISGTYTVMATDTGSPCPVAMTGSAVINAIPAPTAYSVTGGGSYCTGSYGVNVGLSGSNVGISYKLYHGTTFLGALTGTGAPIDFGLETAAGMYTVKASNSVYGCTTMMTDTAYVSLIPVVIPHVTVNSDAPGNTVCTGRTTIFTATPAYPGPNPTYTWTVNGTFAGTGNTYTYIPSNADFINVTMTSDATCAVPGIVTGTATMIVKANIIPTVVINVFPGTFIINGQYDTLRAIAVNGGVTPTYQWYVNGVIVAGATSPTFISNAFKNMDTVMCKVMGCADTAGSAFIIMHVTPRAGIEELSKNNILISPNPSNGAFTISGDLNITNEDVSIKITDIMGRVVYTDQFHSNNGKINKEIRLSNIATAGMYIVSVSSGSQNTVSHIIIK